MKVVEKAVAAVLRERAGRRELLVFRHPLAGVQIPKGTVEPGETVAQAARRELEEESGLRLDLEPVRLGSWDRIVGGGPEGTGPPEVNRWHVCALEAPRGVPEAWRHRARGGPAEEGLAFDFGWVGVDGGLAGRLHPLFGPTCRLIVSHVGR